MMRMIINKLATLFMEYRPGNFDSLDEFKERVALTQMVLHMPPISWAPTSGKFGQPVLASDLFLPRIPDLDNP